MVSISLNLIHHSLNPLQSCLFKIKVRTKYERSTDIQHKITKERRATVEIFNQLYTPFSSIGLKLERENKYNRIATDRINKKKGTKINLRFFEL